MYSLFFRRAVHLCNTNTNYALYENDSYLLLFKNIPVSDYITILSQSFDFHCFTITLSFFKFI